MQKISFKIAKEALANSNLLIKSHEIPGSHSERGLPQTQSHLVAKGDFFIAFQGTKRDAHDFIPTAIERGSQCLIIENEAKLPASLKVPYFLVSDARAAWSVLCSVMYQNPETKMKFYGVTGTDGKTSTVWMASQLVRMQEERCLSVGTLGVFDGKSHWELEHTTPDPPVFFSTLAKGLQNGIDSVIMEVSSHSLIQGKLHNVSFDGAAFTSFARDHLDFHKTVEEYWKAKSLLFTKHMKEGGKVVLNERVFPSFSKTKMKSTNVWTYGFQENVSQKHVHILECNPGEKGQSLRVKIGNKLFQGEIPYLGAHNAENFVAALMLSEAILGFVPPSETWMKLLPIPGRCERIGWESSAPKVFVDFAHTPAGLKTILGTLRNYTKGKLWVVFGCGGDRDHGKRPEMAKMCEQNADMLVLTSDNPRSENPEDIIEQMKEGLLAKSDAVAIVDRKGAIEYAISKADKMDTILIAGKGHEAFQIIGDKKIPFSDQSHAMHYLKLLWGKK